MAILDSPYNILPGCRNMHLWVDYNLVCCRCCCAAVLDVMDVSFLVQFAAFLFISFLFIVFVRKWALKRFNTKRIKTNAESLIGQKAIVTEDICNLTAAGAVRINGAEWSAKLPEGIDDTLTKGTVVIVQEIRGVKLIVEKDK